MIEKFTKAWFAKMHEVRTKFEAKHPENYMAVVRIVIEALADSDEYGAPDPERIHEIDDGHYQGTLVYVVACKGYQPNRYWYAKVSYGSCSGCDTLQSICEYSNDPPTDEQVKQYMTLALHVVQGLHEMGEEVDLP